MNDAKIEIKSETYKQNANYFIILLYYYIIK